MKQRSSFRVVEVGTTSGCAGAGAGVVGKGWGRGVGCKGVEVGVGGGDPQGLISLDHSPVVHPSAFRE